MTALFVRRPTPLTVTFQLANRKPVEATIIGCVLEDGSGESWTIEGYATEDTFHQKKGVLFSGWYRTDTRIGYITLRE